MSIPSSSIDVPRARSSQTSSEQSSASSSSSSALVQGRWSTSGAAVAMMSSSTSAEPGPRKRERDGDAVDAAERDVKSRSVATRGPGYSKRAESDLLQAMVAAATVIHPDGSIECRTLAPGTFGPAQDHLMARALGIEDMTRSLIGAALSCAQERAAKGENHAGAAASWLLSTFPESQFLREGQHTSDAGEWFSEAIDYARLSPTDVQAVMGALLTSRLEPKVLGAFLYGLTDTDNFLTAADKLFGLANDAAFLEKHDIRAADAVKIVDAIFKKAALAHLADTQTQLLESLGEDGLDVDELESVQTFQKAVWTFIADPASLSRSPAAGRADVGGVRQETRSSSSSSAPTIDILEKWAAESNPRVNADGSVSLTSTRISSMPQHDYNLLSQLGPSGRMIARDTTTEASVPQEGDMPGGGR